MQHIQLNRRVVRKRILNGTNGIFTRRPTGNLGGVFGKIKRKQRNSAAHPAIRIGTFTCKGAVERIEQAERNPFCRAARLCPIGIASRIRFDIEINFLCDVKLVGIDDVSLVSELEFGISVALTDRLCGHAVFGFG